MHLVDGVVSLPVLATTTAVAAAGLALSLPRVKADDVPKVALLGAVFFVVGLIRIPIGPVAAHLMLPGLLGLVLGPAIFPALFAGLLMQALLFGFGGVTTIGLNLFTMAVPGFLAYSLFSPLIAKQSGQRLALFAGLAGAFASFGAALLVASALAVSNGGFLLAAKLVVIANLPLMIIEGIVTCAAITLFKQVKPELLAAPLSSLTPRFHFVRHYGKTVS